MIVLDVLEKVRKVAAREHRVSHLASVNAVCDVRHDRFASWTAERFKRGNFSIDVLE